MAIYSQNIEGLDELMKAFAAIGDDAIRKIGPASIDGANIVLNKAKANLIAHNKTGTLAKSLKVGKPSKRSKNKYKLFATVKFSPKAMHGVPLELGHKLVFFGHETNTEVKAYPFMRPAADESKDEVVSAITDAMNKALQEIGGMR